MGGERQPPAAASAVVSKVLDDDDLLIEILLRVGFPTTLVRAALVCKRWLRHVSDQKFLHQFRQLHPPTLLGFCIADGPQLHTPRFIPMLPQPPELAAVIRRVSFSLDTNQGILAGAYIMDFRNGSIFTASRGESELTLGVQNMLCPEGATKTSPQRLEPKDGYIYNYSAILSKEEHGIVSYLYVWMGCNIEKTKSMTHVYILHRGDGTWRKHLTLATDQLIHVRWEPRAVLVDNKIYMASALSESDIVVLDLMASSFSTIQLPQGVGFGILGTIVLSRDDDSSGVYLVYVKDLQLRIWLHKRHNWLLLDNICLREICANLRMPDCTVEDEHTSVLWISQVGDNAEFVFLQMGRLILYLDIKCKALPKVYESKIEDRRSPYYMYPCKMIWPPTFPVLKDDPARNAM